MSLSVSLPLFSEVSCYTHTSRAVPSTYTTLVKLQLGANDAVAARSHTLALHAHRAAVRTTLGSVDHLNAETQRHQPLHFISWHAVPYRFRTDSPSERTPRSILFLLLCRSTCTCLSGEFLHI